MPAYDPRLTPARADLAAKALAEKVDAKRYVEGHVREIVEPQAPLRREPAPDAPLATEALKGERVTVYDENAEGWAWGQLAADGYVGWLPANALAPPGAAATHKVSALRTLVFPGPSIKLSPVEALPLGARLAIARIEGVLGRHADGWPRAGRAPRAHRRLRNGFRRRRRAIPRRSVSVGRQDRRSGSTARVWCRSRSPPAALPVRATATCRNRRWGPPLSADLDGAAPRRGDLVFWSGHVAIVRDRSSLLHANAFHMSVAIEPIAEAVSRIRDSGSEISSVRRIETPID